MGPQISDVDFQAMIEAGTAQYLAGLISALEYVHYVVSLTNQRDEAIAAANLAKQGL